MVIKFGTSGHRGIIKESFTLEHVQAIGQAVADLLGCSSETKIAIGYDPREGNDPHLERGSFTHALTQVLLDAGVTVYFFNLAVPTPLISWFIKTRQLTGGFILTASHNPPEYNGLKFNPSNGAPAPTSVTETIEKKANQLLYKPITTLQKKGTLIKESSIDGFCDDLIQLITPWFSVKQVSSPLPVVIDAKHGTSAPIWNKLLSSLKIVHTILHQTPRSDFGQLETNPLHIDGLSDLIHAQKKKNAVMAIANDPDADRFCVLDETGYALSPEEVMAIIVHFLAKKRIPLAGIASTVASSQLVKSVSRKLEITYHETAVGFKYFAPFLEKAKEKKELAFGVESSGGITVSEHTLEKCGFFPGLCLLFILKETGKPLSQLKQEIENKYGRYYFLEKAITFTNEKKNRIVSWIQKSNLGTLEADFSRSIQALNTTDGLKIIFNHDSWILLRPSGTEPVLRLYAESLSRQETNQLTDQCVAILAAKLES